MALGRFFLSYSSVDGAEFALRLADALESGPPACSVWLDKRDLRPGRDWDEQIAEALSSCRGLLFVMTEDSVSAESVCKQEWGRALSSKKPVIPLRLDPHIEMPFRLGSRQYIDFGDFSTGLAQLRSHLTWMGTRDGIIAELKLRLADVRRELPRTSGPRRPLLEAEIREIMGQLKQLQPAELGPAVPGQHRGVRDRLGAAERSTAAVDSDLTDRHLTAIGLPNRVGMDMDALGAELVAGTIVLDSSICDYAGVDLSHVMVEDAGLIGDVSSHPDYIAADLLTSVEPKPNRPKAHLVEWHAPVIDQGDVVTLELARSDYWTSEATKRLVPRIQAEVAAGRADLLRMPRRLDVHLVVVTGGDNTMLLTRRGKHVASEPSTWMISVGESMDWEFDKASNGLPHPVLTARRCLSDRDELNFPDDLAATAQLRLVAIATEWSEMLVNLIVVARIPEVTYAQVRQYFRKGENLQLDGIAFDLETCVSLLGIDAFAGSNGRGPAMPISDISRVALLAALRSAHPVAEVASTISAARSYLSR
ncbi:toll/interleukin-1 receptor domain-containing protein [Micromonospora lutea]|uniref:TIR domain-containing protein n=1 Tax=Micromonospora lutea TaxID=419825 RepID=A0ABQ4IVD2_9ACTN|nr:toll/interleukin-1 receptor domain-containing protein [Micromonospora lutea]GIJ21877.1 hypothetical protein Vlu01_25010 [Micromonospora lutea]